VKHNGHSDPDPADLIGGDRGKTPDRAFWNTQIHSTFTSESVLFPPLSFFALGEYNLI